MSGGGRPSFSAFPSTIFVLQHSTHQNIRLLTETVSLSIIGRIIHTFMLAFIITIHVFQPALIHERDRSGKTALHYCAENQDLTCVDQLVNIEPSLMNLQDEEGASGFGNYSDSD